MVLACWWWRSRYEEGRRAPRSRLPCAWYGVYYFIEQVQPNPCRCCDDYLSPASSSSAIESCRVTDPPVSDTQVDAASTDDISVAGNQDAPSSRSPGERGGRLYMGGTDQAGVPWMSWNALAVWDACESWWRFIHRTPLEKFWSVSASHLGRHGWRLPSSTSIPNWTRTEVSASDTGGYVCLATRRHCFVSRLRNLGLNPPCRDPHKLT